MKKRMKPLEEKITKEDVAEQRKAESARVASGYPSHCNDKFKYTFNFFASQNIYHLVRDSDVKDPFKTSASKGEYKPKATPIEARQVVQKHLYEGIPEKLERLNNAGLKKLNATLKNKWQYKNLDELRYGRAPFYKKVADYFYDSFDLIVGPVWASRIEPMELVLGDIREIFTKLIDESVPVSWEATNPTNLLEIALHAQQVGVDISERILPFFRLQRKGSTRLSDHGNGPLEGYEPKRPEFSLYTEEKYKLRISGIPEGWSYTVIQFGYVPLTDKKTGDEVQAQHVNNLEPHFGDIRVVGKCEGYILASPHPGRYGYCVVAQKGEAYLEQLDKLNGKRYLNPNEFGTLCINIAKECIPKNDTAIGLLDYVVEPAPENF